MIYTETIVYVLELVELLKTNYTYGMLLNRHSFSQFIECKLVSDLYNHFTKQIPKKHSSQNNDTFNIACIFV